MQVVGLIGHLLRGHLTCKQVGNIHCVRATKHCGETAELACPEHAKKLLVCAPEIWLGICRVIGLLEDRQINRHRLCRLNCKQCIHGAHVQGNNLIELVHALALVVEA